MEREWTFHQLNCWGSHFQVSSYSHYVVHLVGFSVTRDGHDVPSSPRHSPLPEANSYVASSWSQCDCWLVSCPTFTSPFTAWDPTCPALLLCLCLQFLLFASLLPPGGAASCGPTRPSKRLLGSRCSDLSGTLISVLAVPCHLTRDRLTLSSGGFRPRFGLPFPPLLVVLVSFLLNGSWSPWSFVQENGADLAGT